MSINIPIYKRISKEEELKHVKLAKSGDTNSYNVLLCANINQILNIAHKMSNHGIDIEDLIQEGMLSICEAIDKFKLSKNVKFNTYFYYWIYDKIGLYIKKHSKPVRIPMALYSYFHKLKNNQISSSRFSSKKLAQINSIGAYNVSLNEPINAYQESTVENSIYLDKDIISYNYDLLSCLDQETQNILIDWAGLNDKKLTHKELSLKYNKPVFHIQKIIKSAKLTLKNQFIKS